MLDREQIETFATIVEEQSFDRAALRLSVTRGAVSHRIRSLEESLRSVLIVRGNPAVPTASGEILLRHVKSLRLLESSTLSQLNPKLQARAYAPIAVAVNDDSMATWIPGLLWSMLKDLKITMEIVVDNQNHTLEHMLKGEVAGCISTQLKPLAGFATEKLGCMEYRCYASREFIHQWFEQGFSLPEVLLAPAIVFNRKARMHDAFLEQVFGFRVNNYVRHYLPSAQTMLAAISHGVGYGLLPLMQVQSHPLAAELVEVAPRHGVSVPLYWSHWLAEPAISMEVTRRIVAYAHEVLQPVSASPS
jgi:LysR family transcriptional regulator (chromosome initiation inhibitor)